MSTPKRRVHVESNFYHESAGEFDAALALPDNSGHVPLVIVVGSIWGVNDNLKAVVDRYAKRGFIVIAPDPFYRTRPGVLDPRTQLDLALERVEAWKPQDGVDDVRAILSHAKTFQNWNGKFAIAGYCFGGRLAMMGLTELGADAAVSFHGVGLELHLDKADNVTKPFSFHFGADDEYVPIEVVERLRAGLAGRRATLRCTPEQRTASRRATPRISTPR